MLKALIEQLGEELNMKESIVLNGSLYSLAFDPDISVEAIPLENGYLLKGKIGPCPQNQPDTLLLKAMEANLFGQGTRQMVIGLKEDENVLTLSLEVDYNSSYKDFKEKLEDFISVIEFWRQETANHR